MRFNYFFLSAHVRRLYKVKQVGASAYVVLGHADGIQAETVLLS